MKQQNLWLGLTTLIALLLSVAAPPLVHAQFGGGTQIVFDPQMFGRQLQQLQQESATVTNLAQQLQYMIKNTTGGGAGIWQTNEGFLTNLGNLINEQEGLSYSVQGLTQQFQQLYPGFNTVTTARVQSPQATMETTLNTLNGALVAAQAQAQDFQAEQATLRSLELKNQTAIGNLQAVQVSNEIALAQVQQLQTLRQLAMAMMNSQNVASANQINNQVQSNLAAAAFFSAPPSAASPDAFHSAAAPPQP
jgi:P-type conjugative transfer protein TrbJ